MKKLFGLLFLGVYCIQSTIAQDKIADHIEDQQNMSTLESENFQGQEAQLLNKFDKIAINNTNVEELESIGILNSNQIQAIISHIKRLGKLSSIYELKTIASLDPETLEKILPYVYIQEKPITYTPKPFRLQYFSNENHHLTIRSERIIEPQKGFIDHTYKGIPYGLYLRYQNTLSGRYSVGFVCENDKGEPFRWAPKLKYYGVDHIKGHILFQNIGLIKSLIIGSYSFNSGQGLVFGNGYFLAKSGESVLGIKRNQVGIKPFNSVLESNYFEGIGATFQVSKYLEISCFLSKQNIDTKINEDTSAQNDYFSSLYTTGYHRTSSELSNRKSILKLDLGTNLRWTIKSLSLGFSYCNTHFMNNHWKPVIMHRNETIYNFFAFRGSQNSVYSTDFTYYIKNISLFGEIAFQGKSPQAAIAGAQIAAHKNLDFGVLYRKYATSFHSFYAGSFAEYNSTNDEEGVYFSSKYEPLKGLTIAGYYDVFINKTLKYRMYSPGIGKEYLLRVQFKPNKKVLFFLQIRKEYKQYNEDIFEENTYQTFPSQKTNGHIGAKYELEKYFSLQSRIYITQFMLRQTTSGDLIMQDINFKKPKFSLSMRLALFNTDYNTRIYLYERDVLYSFSFPSYQGNGLRTYLLLHLKLTDRLLFWIRWSRSRFFDRSKTGSSNDEVEGTHVDEIKCQLKWSLGKH